MVREVTGRLAPGGVAVFTTHSLDALPHFTAEVPAGEVRRAMTDRGFAYVPYPWSTDHSYGLTFHEPALVEERVAALAPHPMRRVLHEHQGWGELQDVWAFART
jgi:hypothetical protein